MGYTKNDADKAIDLVGQWLKGAIYVGFRFDSNFTLFFDCNRERSFAGYRLPWQIQLNLLEDWWIGDRQNWAEKVSRDGEGVEPDEPVKAFELAKLRWTEGASISEGLLDERGLKIRFNNGISLETALICEDEYCFSISEFDVSDERSKWSVVLDSEGLHVRTP